MICLFVHYWVIFFLFKLVLSFDFFHLNKIKNHGDFVNSYPMSDPSRDNVLLIFILIVFFFNVNKAKIISVSFLFYFILTYFDKIHYLHKIKAIEFIKIHFLGYSYGVLILFIFSYEITSFFKKIINNK